MDRVDARIDCLQRDAAGRSDVLPLAGGLPSRELFPRAALSAAFLSAVGEPDCAALQYGWPEGDVHLRTWIADRLRARGAPVDADDVIVTNGAQQAIAIAVEQITSGREEASVAVDEESYPAALELFRATGATLMAHGKDRPTFSYAMPGVANPRGTGMSDAERERLLATGAPVIADEAYAELRFDGVVPRPLLADARDRVWHVGTLSKTLCPGLRVGWLVPPPRHRDAALRAKHDGDLQAGSLAQAIVRRFVVNDDFDGRLARARAFYRARADRLSGALRRRVSGWRFCEPEGGFSLFVETDLEGDEAEFLELVTGHGVAFDPGRLFQRQRRAPGDAPIALRLCYSSASEAELDEAARRIEGAARAFRPMEREGWRHA